MHQKCSFESRNSYTPKISVENRKNWDFLVVAVFVVITWGETYFGSSQTSNFSPALKRIPKFPEGGCGEETRGDFCRKTDHFHSSGLLKTFGKLEFLGWNLGKITEPSSVSFHSRNGWSWIFLGEKTKMHPKKSLRWGSAQVSPFYFLKTFGLQGNSNNLCIPRSPNLKIAWKEFLQDKKKQRFLGDFCLMIVGNVYPCIPGSVKDEMKIFQRAREFIGTAGWQTGQDLGGEKNEIPLLAPLLTADSSSFPSQEERKPRWKEEISEKEMKRALLARFFSCLTQLSDFAFKFKTADQTTRGTLYSCQEPRWDLSGTLLHARNKKLCLSPSFFGFFLSTYGATCKKEPNSWLGEGQDLWHFISWAGRGQQEEEENLIISFPK